MQVMLFLIVVSDFDVRAKFRAAFDKRNLT